MASPDFLVDPYIDPDSGLLRNLVGAQTQRALDEAEGALSFARLVQLVDHPVKPTGDLEELRDIHRHLFQDVYAWAGELRTVDIRKNEEGAQFFLPVSMIERAAMFAAKELRDDNELQGPPVTSSSNDWPTITMPSTTSTHFVKVMVGLNGCSGAESHAPRGGSSTGVPCAARPTIELVARPQINAISHHYTICSTELSPPQNRSVNSMRHGAAWSTQGSPFAPSM